MATTPMSHSPVDLGAQTELIDRFITEVWNAKNPEAADTFLTSDYVDHAYQPPNSEGLKQTILVTMSAFPDFEFTIEDSVAQGDTVVVRMIMRGTHSGPFRDTPATNKAVEVGVYRTFRIVDGKIAEHRGLLDTATLLRQISAEPAS
jgi:steroid delta-isomerase-like uncharacterized protein